MVAKKAVISVWVLGDQLLKAHPAIEQARKTAGDENVRVLLVWNWNRVKRRQYQRKKLVLLWSAMRHYVEWLRGEGLEAELIESDTLEAALKQHVHRHHPTRLLTMAASEYLGRQFQQHKLQRVACVEVEVLPNTQFLVGQYDPNPNPDPHKRYIMENFYRDMRQHFDVLMDGRDIPAGGEWNYDAQNRKPLPKKGLHFPEPPRFEPDDITQEIMRIVDETGWGIGTVDGFDYAVTHEDAEAALRDFIEIRLPLFGDYEDAMTQQHRTLFHSMLSLYFNTGLLTPLDAVRAAEQAYHEGDAPINAVEGFIRQVMGWREFMYWQYWQQMPELVHKNAWHATSPVPDFFWTGETDMNCLHHTITDVINTGYSHHIQRLMVVSNFFMLTAVEPQAAVNWFIELYIDAYDWVMQSNVVGMGLNADGGRTATKPYISSANYINKMSDYCQHCRFNPRKRLGEDACPYNYLYWNFLITHEEKLRANARFGQAVLGLRHLDDEERTEVQKQAAEFIESLPTGKYG
jgi:deoxyribodipyrimidine photolyase-related protein